jgi:hypothetical protein
MHRRFSATAQMRASSQALHRRLKEQHEWTKKNIEGQEQKERDHTPGYDLKKSQPTGRLEFAR